MVYYAEYLVLLNEVIETLEGSKDRTRREKKVDNSLNNTLRDIQYAVQCFFAMSSDPYTVSYREPYYRKLRDLKIKVINELKFSVKDKGKLKMVMSDVKSLSNGKLRPLTSAKNKSVREHSAFLEKELSDILECVRLLINNKENNEIQTDWTLKEVALYHALINKPINRDVANKIANEFGHQSGEALYQNYSKKYQRRVDRIGLSDESKTVIKNQIDRYEKVIAQIEDESARSKAIDEVTELKSYLTDLSN